MSQPPLIEPDAYDLRPATLLTKEDRKAEIEALRVKCEEKIAEFFSQALPEVLDGYKELALHAEKEAVREKASRKILDTFKRVQVDRPQAPSVLIQNNTLVPEMSVINGRPVSTIEAGPVTVALTGIGEPRKPKPKLIGPEPSGMPHKSQYSYKNTDVPTSAKDIKPATGEDQWQPHVEVKR